MLNEHRAMFCVRLKAMRESRGVSLDHIAAVTKIRASVFRDLEANNLSRWPKGVFRRSYFRDYLRAIDLEPEPTFAEFVRLFPDDEARCVKAAVTERDAEATELSIIFADDPGERIARVSKRLTAAAVDATAVAVVSGATTLLLHADFWMTGALVALTYYSISSVVFGRGFGVHWLDPRRVRWTPVPDQNLTPKPMPNRASWLMKGLSRTTPSLSITGEG